VGLGNPGPEYLETRHNAGFRLADHLVARWRLGPLRRGDRARVAEGSWDGQPVRVLEPQTYMNRSGAALAPLLALPDFDPSRDLMILVDDVALPVGRFRLRGAGTAGGHNGLKSVEGVLRRQDYARLRIGVGPVPPGLDELTDFVLDALPAEDREMLDALLDPMADAVETWLDAGIEQAMTRHNR
jgi:peptidyl-tRNA hydrolase, PTH1 family